MEMISGASALCGRAGTVTPSAYRSPPFLVFCIQTYCYIEECGALFLLSKSFNKCPQTKLDVMRFLFNALSVNIRKGV